MLLELLTDSTEVGGVQEYVLSNSSAKCKSCSFICKIIIIKIGKIPSPIEQDHQLWLRFASPYIDATVSTRFKFLK